MTFVLGCVIAALFGFLVCALLAGAAQSSSDKLIKDLVTINADQRGKISDLTTINEMLVKEIDNLQGGHSLPNLEEHLETLTRNGLLIDGA